MLSSMNFNYSSRWMPRVGSAISPFRNFLCKLIIGPVNSFSI